MEPAPRPDHRHAAGRIKAEEPHPRPAAIADVRPNVELGEGTEHRRRGQAAQADVLHPERDDPEVGAPLEGIELEFRWDARPKRVRIHRPMGEQEVDPAHPHHPRALSPAR